MANPGKAVVDLGQAIPNLFRSIGAGAGNAVKSFRGNGAGKEAVTMFDNVAKEGFWANVKAGGGYIKRGFQSAMGGIADAATSINRVAGDAAGAAVAAPFQAVHHGVGKPLAKGAFKSALWIVEKPIELGLRAITGSVNFVGRAFRDAPLIMFPATALGGVMIAGDMTHKRRAALTQQDLMAKAASVQAQANTYMNSVSPEEAAAMDARLRQGNQPQFAAAQAERAAQAGSTPAV